MDHPINFLELTAYSWTIMMLYWLYAGLKTKMTIKRQPISSRLLQLILVLSAFGLIYSNRLALGFLGSRYIPSSGVIQFAGLVINLAGIVFAILARARLGTNWSAIVTVKQNHELIQNGPYAITRHPIYTGMFFGMTGAVLVLGEFRGLIALAFFFTSIQIKMAMEEKFMKSSFPAYGSYQLKVRKLIPFIY